MKEVAVILYDGSLKVYYDFRIVANGVVVNITEKSEVLFPWHKVDRVLCPKGTIEG
jgi:hypothetical protein